MSPSAEEKWATIVECKTRIGHLEEVFKELKQQLRNQRKEKIESRRHISDKRLGIYLATASIIGYIACEIAKWLISLAS